MLCIKHLLTSDLAHDICLINYLKIFIYAAASIRCFSSATLFLFSLRMTIT